MDSFPDYSRPVAPMAAKEEDVDDLDLAESSRLTAKPTFLPNLPKFPNNSFKLHPMREPDSEEVPTNVSEVSDADSRKRGSIPDDSSIDMVDGASNGIDDGFLPEKPTQGYPKPGSEPKYNGEYPASNPEIPYGVGFGLTPDLSDVNVYQHKKTVAQGMMDIALLSANANQLRYVLESGGNHPYYYASLSLIGISLLLQVGVGVGLILNSRYNVSYETSMRKANRINNYTVLAIFLITVMNVFISAFGIASVNTSVGAFPTSPRLQEEGTELELS